MWHTNFIDNVRKRSVDAQEAKGAGVKDHGVRHGAEFVRRPPHRVARRALSQIAPPSRRRDSFDRAFRRLQPDVAAGTRRAPVRKPLRRSDRAARLGPVLGLLSAHEVVSPALQHRQRNGAPAGVPSRRQLRTTRPASAARATRVVNGKPGVYVSYREGGTLIEYEDEDPKIKPDYEAMLKQGRHRIEDAGLHLQHRRPLTTAAFRSGSEGPRALLENAASPSSNGVNPK